ncbi:DnaA ATPase domain-containing protein [Rheinheimera oceanensis]|uniref:DnaA ATPase domain-containing protein n=1 Tax=Rheinheimera oceanensis TaxID=2817449 RepID=UPI001BFD7D18|nr:DnaA/Hda family protein [Rheinheimera oceanensis]
MKDVNFSNFVTADYNCSAIDIGRKFIADPTSVQMVIDSHSGNGDGMTHLMMSLADELISTGFKVVRYPAYKLLNEAASDANLLGQLQGIDCLLLDDINFLFDKPTAVSADIFNMLVARNGAGKKTICAVAIAASDIGNAIPQPYLGLLYSATVCRLGTPTRADKFRITMVKIESLGISFDTSVEEIIEQAGNIRELEGKLTRYAVLQNIQRYSLAEAKRQDD